MAGPNRNNATAYKKTVQETQNWSFDEIYNVLAVMLLGEYDDALYRLQVDSDGKLKVNVAAGIDYDYLDVQQTDADTETYVFKTGGSGGTTVRTVVVNYTDSTKENIDNVSWS